MGPVAPLCHKPRAKPNAKDLDMPDYTHAPEPLGVPTRRAALRLLDAVLRRGESLESALPAATRAIHGQTAVSPTPSPPRRCAASPISTR